MQNPENVISESVRIQRAANAAHSSNWTDFATHRARVMDLVLAQRGGRLCILGAGNCDDVALPELAQNFEQIHLCDLDEEALARATARLPASIRSKVIVHGAVDLTGLLSSLEHWGRDHENLKTATPRAAESIASRLGTQFELVLSSCLLSQLCVPFYRVLARTPGEWLELMVSIVQIHWKTLALLTKPGGHALIINDLFYGARSETVLNSPAPRWETLDTATVTAIRNGFGAMRNPEFVLKLLYEPPCAGLFKRPDMTEPWYWTVESSVMLAYAILCQRA